MKDKVSVGLVSLATAYFDLAVAEHNRLATIQSLSKSHVIVGPDHVLLTDEDLQSAITELKHADLGALIIQMGTFPDGDMPLRIAQSLRVPVVVHGLPEPDPAHNIAINSLCGANITTFALHAVKHPHVWVHCPPDGEQLEKAVRSAETYEKLRHCRIGMFGYRVPGFLPSSFDEALLRSRLGVQVEHISLGELEAADSLDRKPAPGVQRTRSGGVLADDVLAALERRYFKLDQAVSEHDNCDAFAVKDWNELWGIWAPLGWLQDDGHVIAVEGDMNAAITLLCHRLFTGSVGFLTDLSSLNYDSNTITLWHYGVATQLARHPQDVSVDEEGNIVQFGLRPGPVTMARIGNYEGDLRILTVEGEILDESVHVGRAGGLWRPRNSSASEVISHMLDNGWEHHLLASYGNDVGEWGYLAKLLGLSWTRL